MTLCQMKERIDNLAMQAATLPTADNSQWTAAQGLGFSSVETCLQAIRDVIGGAHS